MTEYLAIFQVVISYMSVQKMNAQLYVNHASLHYKSPRLLIRYFIDEIRDFQSH